MNLRDRYLTYLIFSATLLIAATVIAPLETIKIKLQDRAMDDKFEKSQAIIPVFEYESNTIEEYTLIGDFSKKELSTFDIKLPNMEGCIDTAYSFIFFGAADADPNRGYALMLIGNYRRGTRPALLFIDRNLNFDLSDDGPPDTMSYKDDYVDITLTNPDFTQGTYTVRLSRFPIGKNEKYKQLLSEHYTKNSGNKKFTTVNFSFREQRINVLKGDYASGQDSFSIALKDNNCNGIYNEPGDDFLFIAPYGTEVFNRNPIMISDDDKEPTSFEWNGKKYIATNIDKAGSYIELSIDADAELENKLAECEKIPKIKFVTPDNKVYSLKDFKKSKKHIYIFVYNADDPTYQANLDSLRQLHTNYADKLNIICLNYGQTPKQVYASLYFDNITWLVGLSNANINNQLYIEETPTGILINHKRKLCKSGVTPGQLLRYYQSQNQ